MALNKKQKKQIEIARKKIKGLHELLVAAKQQPDDPQEVPRLQQQIAKIEAEIEHINAQK